MDIFTDRKFRKPRKWSNEELKKIAHLFTGDVINVSGWKDIDKEGGHYTDYFCNAKSYAISNYKTEARGMQGLENEFFLDLTADLSPALIGKYDVVFNHTTLEHIYDVKKAFTNLCLMSKDIVILVVPFLQQMHSDYGDYWRFTPSCIKQLFEENGMKIQYLSFNNDKHTSVYIFAIATKNPNVWSDKIPFHYAIECKQDFVDSSENYIGCRAVTNTIWYKIKTVLAAILGKLR